MRLIEVSPHPLPGLLARSARWPDLARSFAVRAALGIAAVVLLVCTLGFGWGYMRAQAALRAQLDTTVAAEAESFITDYETLGPAGLLAAVSAQAQRRGGIAALLQTVTGQRLAGGVPGEPGILRGFATLEGPDGQSVRALGAVLDGRLNLVVAADLAPAGRTAAALAGTLPLVGGVAALAALGLGWLAARRLERRLRLVSEATRAVIAGDLSRRLPGSGTDDEFDRLIDTINIMLGRIEALVEGLKQVSTDVAHDLRSPLSRLRLRLEGALAQPREAAADAATLDAALGELDGVLATFAALLRIARAEAGLRTGFAAVDLSGLARQLCETFAAVAEEAGQMMTADIAPAVGVAGDPMLLRQVLANLLENALTHGGTGVHVVVRLRGATRGEGPLLEVADDGPGIPAAEREKVLRRFYRLDRSRNTPGTGLGLAMAAAAAKLHGVVLTLADVRPTQQPPGLLVSLRFPPADPPILTGVS